MTTIKIPPCYDVSHHKEIFDFKKVDPKPALFITKATEDIAFVDDKFVRFFSGMMEIEVIRGAYHFFRKAYNPYRQAEHFIRIISKMDILPTDFLILDVEEGGEKASQLWAWFKTVKDAFPDNRQLLYSRKNILDPIIMTEGEKEFFRKIPTWPAGYPYFPDLYSSIPKGYVPDQSKYGPSVLWQYSSHGRVEGITTPFGKPTDVDLNWIDPIFYQTLGSNVGVTTMALEQGNVKPGVIAKVWDAPGGQQIDSLQAGTAVRIDSRTVFSGVEYGHLTSPLLGYTKTQWLTLTPVPPPDPEPEPEPEPEPDPTLPDYLTAHSEDGTVLGYYDKRPA